MVSALAFGAERAMLGLALGMLLLGAVLALASTHALKKLAGALFALMGAMLALASLSMPAAALGAGAAVLIAVAVLGAALLARLQEAYGGLETATIDEADAGEDPTEPPR